MNPDGRRRAKTNVVPLKRGQAAGEFLMPRHLRATTRRWAEEVLEGYEFESHHVRLLVLACEAWDQGQAARGRIARLGMTYSDRFGQPRLRPEVQVERDARVSFARILRERRLDSTEGPEARPPALGER